MNRILLIHTALQTAYAGVAVDGRPVAWRSSPQQKDHAAFLHPAVEAVMKEAGWGMGDLHGVAVAAGPGSYTGLRVGMSAAKGFCYALTLPLVMVDTLEWLAAGVRAEGDEKVCPMVDARRAEVFTALYDAEGRRLMEPAAMVLDEGSFRHELDRGVVLFCGDGADKWKGMTTHPNARFAGSGSGIGELAALAEERFRKGGFTDTASAEPLYVKAFQGTTAKPRPT